MTTTRTPGPAGPAAVGGDRRCDRRGTRFADRRSLPLLVLTLLLAGLVLIVGYANKARCVGPQFNRWGQSQPDLGLRISRDVCYSDIQFLWAGRQVDEHIFPYLHGAYDPVDRQISGGTLEYPVLTGMVVYLTGLASHNDADFLRYNAIVLAVCGMLIAFMLCRLAGIRAWWWALAPPLVFYAFHNWDLLAVACVVGAFALVRRSAAARRPAVQLVMAGALLGVGGAFKLYPLMFALPLAWWTGIGQPGPKPGPAEPAGQVEAAANAAKDLHIGAARWRLAGGILLVAGGVFAIANLPFMIAGFPGWWASFEFQWSRPIDPSTNSIWFWGARPYSDSDNRSLQGTLGKLSTISTAAGLLLAVFAGWWRSRRLGVYPWLQVSAAMLCAYLLLNKVHSPQYVLWLLPFFVLLRIRAGWILAYFLADAAVGIGFFRWQYLMLQGVPSGVYESWPLQAVMIGVWGRAGLLVGLFVAFLGSESVLDKPPERPPDESPDEPPERPPDEGPTAAAPTGFFDRAAAADRSNQSGALAQVRIRSPIARMAASTLSRSWSSNSVSTA